MVSSVPKELTEIEEEFDNFMILYSSLDLGDKNPKTNGTRSTASIVCYKQSTLVGVINFHERQPPPINSYRGSRVPHININFHVSRFNDISILFEIICHLLFGLMSINQTGDWLVDRNKKIIDQRKLLDTSW